MEQKWVPGTVFGRQMELSGFTAQCSFHLKSLYRLSWHVNKNPCLGFPSSDPYLDDCVRNSKHGHVDTNECHRQGDMANTLNMIWPIEIYPAVFFNQHWKSPAITSLMIICCVGGCIMLYPHEDRANYHMIICFASCLCIGQSVLWAIRLWQTWQRKGMSRLFLDSGHNLPVKVWNIAIFYG